jgi:hypothetical protein
MNSIRFDAKPISRGLPDVAFHTEAGADAFKLAGGEQVQVGV